MKAEKFYTYRGALPQPFVVTSVVGQVVGQGFEMRLKVDCVFDTLADAADAAADHWRELANKSEAEKQAHLANAQAIREGREPV